MPRIAVNSLGVIGLLTILVGTGAAIFFFGGFFSVAANDPDPDIVNWALIHVREASIARYATDQPSGRLMTLTQCTQARAPIPNSAAPTVTAVQA